jgi:D-sedoheptulose 7-phosphate isomerase
MSYVEEYLGEVQKIVSLIEPEQIERMVRTLLQVRENGGRLFFRGVGGGAANAAHAVNDFRKIAGFEAYTPADNVSELTARANDNGWETIFVDWLKGSRLGDRDAIFVFSVGGGDAARHISANIVEALKYGKQKGSKVLGIVGRDGGYTAEVADACLVIPTVNAETVTAHAESFQGVVWHCIVSHPSIKTYEMKWESVR